MNKTTMNILSLFTLLLFSCNPGPDSLNIEPADGYPRWMASGNTFTQQTSGIAFVKEDKAGKHFLLADDIGDLFNFTIKDDTLFTLKKITLSQQVKAYISKFPKKDFEEIAYDKYTGKVILSIEGNGKNHKSISGLYELKFLKDDVLSGSVVSISKIKVTPEEKFTEHVETNIGFEGIAIDENNIYAALEGFTDNIIFSDSTLIYIIDKKDYTIKAVVSTKEINIATICGLYSAKNNSVYGVDRNNKRLFQLEFNPDFSISHTSVYQLPTSVPNYESFNYVVAFESVTMDNENNFYLIDDPWKKFYIPSNEILSQMDDETVKMFRSYVPAIYKFKLNN